MLDVNALNRRWSALRDERFAWDTAWKDLARHFLPTRWRSDTDRTSHKKPDVLNADLVNSVGVLDMRTLAAGMQGGMTSPVRPWFRLSLRDEKAGQKYDAATWLDEVTRRMQTLFHRSNLYNALHTLYADIGTFGTGVLVETADADGLNFQVLRAGEYALDINDKNLVDTLFRRISMTARQIVQEFGEDAVPDAILTASKRMGTNELERFDVVHAVFPRHEAKRRYGQRDSLSMPYVSVWWMPEMLCAGKPALLRESGFEEFPAFCPRWDISGTDVYGRSPAMDVLPDCRMLQSMTATLIKTQHLIAQPPIVADSALKSSGIRLIPGSVHWINAANGVNPVMPVYQPNPAALEYAAQGMMRVEQAIHNGLYSDLFKMLITTDRRQITATEIEAREQEKMILIGPVVERLHKELFSPLIARTFNLMLRYNAIPQPPDGIAGEEMRVEFVSVLAQAQRLVSTSGIDQTMSFIMGLAQAFPEALDVIDSDKLVETYAEDLGVPAGILRPEEERIALRQERAQAQARTAQQQAAAMEAQQARALGGAAKDLGQTVVGAGEQNALEALISGLRGM